MHDEVLTKEQTDLLDPLSKFLPDFGLVGGTAVALHIGHRRSIDFDMFTLGELPPNFLPRLKRRFDKFNLSVSYNVPGQLNLLVNAVKLTFFAYPYKIDFNTKFKLSLKLPDLLTLAAMKVHALSNRATWKDYVDLYFIMRDHHPLSEIVNKGKELFASEFNEKLLRTQLAYFDDINYTEQVEYMPGFEEAEEKIKSKLVELSLS